ncbi:unnamed protein product, partial [Iphiclides podalirius]
MEADLLGGLASGDTVPAAEAVPALKREQDSTDDFEHLDRESKRDEFGESPSHHGAARVASQNFLDMERDEFVDTPRAPSVTDKLADHIADKFTDSESDADTAGESPLHRPEPPQQKSSVPILEPSAAVAPARDPTLILAATPAPPPTPAPVPIPSPAPSVPEPVVEKRAEGKATSKTEAPHEPPAAEPKPHQEPAPQPKPAPPEPVKAEPVRAPTAHVIEAEVIFCQMGLGEVVDSRQSQRWRSGKIVDRLVTGLEPLTVRRSEGRPKRSPILAHSPKNRNRLTETDLQLVATIGFSEYLLRYCKLFVRHSFAINWSKLERRTLIRVAVSAQPVISVLLAAFAVILSGIAPLSELPRMRRNYHFYVPITVNGGCIAAEMKAAPVGCPCFGVEPRGVGGLGWGSGGCGAVRCDGTQLILAAARAAHSQVASPRTRTHALLPRRRTPSVNAP